MKKLFVLALLLTVTATVAKAEVRLRMESPDSIVLTADSPCEKLAALELFGDGDEDEDANKKALLKALSETAVNDENAPIDYQGRQDLPFISKYAFSRVTNKSIFTHELYDDFDSIRIRLIDNIQRVNWETGYQITAADMSLGQKLKFLFGAACSLTLPVMNTYGLNISQEQANAVGDTIVSNIQYALLDSELKKEIRYTPEGLYFSIITNKPFLLLTIDNEVFENLLKTEAQILLQYNRKDKDRLLAQQLLNMDKFFEIRADFLQDSDFLDNTKKLAKFSKLAAGDAWSTYKLLADHSIRMQIVKQEGQLNPKYEENTFLALKKAFIGIGQDVAKHQQEVSTIRKDPAYQEMVKRVDNDYKHQLTTKEEATKELQDMQDPDKELILRAYKK